MTDPVRGALQRGLRASVISMLLVGCDGAERRDAETVLIAVRRFRTADHSMTVAALEALKATRCVAPDACRTRDACVAAGDPTVKALRLKAEVEKGLAALDQGRLTADSPDAQQLPKKLAEAEALLKQGHDGLAACDEHVQALKRRHRI